MEEHSEQCQQQDSREMDVRSDSDQCTYGFSYAPYNDLQAFKDACTENTIAIMIEPVQGEGGVHPATQEFMKGLTRIL